MNVREPVMSEHARKVLAWRESFLKMEENRFFEIMRMYLGEIKTPYNKQKLIMNLEGFFRKKENLINIKSFLSEDDIKLICAIVFIPDATENKLTSFFKNTFSYSFLYETLLNLEERLIIFREKKEVDFSDSLVIELNPFLEEAFYDLISVEQLLKDIVYQKSLNAEDCFLPELIPCFVSFVLENPNLAKQDGSLKKHTLEIAENYFGSSTKMLELLYKSFLNLSILKEKSRGVEFDWNKLNSFVNQSFFEQLVYIIVASCGHFTRESLFNHGQSFVDTFLLLKDKSFTEDLFYKTCFLVSVQKHSFQRTSTSRFGKILSEGRSRLQNDSTSDRLSNSVISSIDSIFDACVMFGVFCFDGKTKSGDSVYCINTFYKDSFVENDSVKGMVNISSGMELSLMPGFQVKNSIKLVKFLSLEKYDRVSIFSISKKSIMRGFDFGLSNMEIINFLEDVSLYKIPELLSVQIDEWWSSYSSASFYRGFVLKVDSKTAVLAENNSIFASHIHSIIAPGIYLLDVENDEQAMNLIKESGFDFVGKIKSVTKEDSSLDFSSLNLDGNVINFKTSFEKPSENIEVRDSAKIEKDLIDVLKSMELDDEQRECLELRIEHKVIVNPEQLNSGILRIEKIQAGAMDFAGKIYIIEQALKNEENIEIKFDKNGKSILGKPINIRKTIDDSFIQIKLIPEDKIREFSLGKASFVKRIRKTIYQS